MFASINLLKGGGESRIIYTLDPGAEIENIWQKDIFLCTPLLGISQWGKLTVCTRDRSEIQ